MDQPPINAVPELVCYLHPGWEPRIRPASHERDWMDQTAGNAYRCLPLAVANSHGWEVPSPVGFSAMWDGTAGTSAVRIVVDDGSPPGHWPVSLFGHGVLTWHVQGLFRTSPGWNLWVGGPPNAVKDAIQPLTGIVETDWSPFTFTMNWRFTRSNQWVRWEKGEPFCFFFPVPRGVLAEVQPRYAPLAENPDLQRQFAAWSASRNAFHAERAKCPAHSGAEAWQRDYFTGRDMDGKRCPTHEAKLRVRPFEGPR